MKRIIIIGAAALTALASCKNNQFAHDASGNFEATEVVVSAEVPGKIEALNLVEGKRLEKGQALGVIDTTQLYLKKLQLLATSKSVSVRKPDVQVQVAATKEQISKAETEKRRVQSLLGDGAATQKQLDDLNSQLAVLKRTLAAQLNSLSTSVRGLDREGDVYQIQVAQIDDQLRRSRIVSPIQGTVLAKYAEAGELAQAGKPLFRIADTEHLFLKAYVVADQLPEIKIGQAVKVYVDRKDGNTRTYDGTVTWVADDAEFTPKTIQTKDERQNLVYAVKIAVANTDGSIKIGMYGDVDFVKKVGK